MSMTMNRRNFLKGAIATGAIAATGAALSGCAKTDAADPDMGHADTGADATSYLTADSYEHATWSFCRAWTLVRWTRA